MSDNGQFYVGQADPHDAGSESTAFSFFVKQLLLKVRTSTLVEIVTAPYDQNGDPITPGTVGPIGFIDARPMVNMIDGTGTAMPHGTIYRLPYYRAQGGTKGAVIIDPHVGDRGVVVFCDRDISQVKATGAQANPGSRRKHNMADGIFIGMCIGQTPSQSIAYQDDKIVVQTGTAGMVINGCTITSDGNVITAAGVNLNTHLHGQVTVGGDDTGPPVT